MFGQGISREGDLLDLGVTQGVVDKSGTWFSFESQRIGQGREAAKAYLKQNPEIARSIEARIREKLLPEPQPAAEVGNNGGTEVKEAKAANAEQTTRASRRA